ncbi:hypothetical protein LV84_02038 [Algoriphagus ratkowskyi]|uniref:VLRF1 domain-containing protein n=1 Tax=Algoriphagus ratkowskyi TaxID=57028 RepID=A0A2W7RQY7_9BACT|nr:hypothetical protein [Algoriphagus ratkowskyi]PZX56909.1 hypothetical protein LV84_02038 [Algoriphagus ratkowskyi]TXD79822.1 hypothetical protein ESW18_01440 [Algoriphagus ratkowskyi]
MISGNPKLISLEKYQAILQIAEKQGLEGTYDKTKHQWVISNTETWTARVSIPWNVAPDEKGELTIKDDFHLALVMIRAGIAVTGYFHNGVMLDHKVFRAYMVRQKQGKSQIKYLKTKGKSRAGSRLRLGESEQFFEEINERLQRYDSDFPITTWGISCGMTLFPYFFASETPPPFSKKQDNLISIPFHVQQPDFETLQTIHKKLNGIHLLVSEAGESIFDDIEGASLHERNEEEDW